MKIFHVSTVHSRNDLRIFEKECRSLSKHGWDVNYIVADGLGDQVVDGIKIIDIGRRSGNRIIRIIFDTNKAITRALKLNAGLIHFHDPEILLAVWRLVLIQRTLKVKIIYDVHEDFRVLIISKNYIPKPLRYIASYFFKVLEDFLCKKIDAIVVPQPEMQNAFSKINNNCICLLNYVDLNKYDFKKVSGSKPILFYPGALTWSRGMQNMIDLANELGDKADFYVAGDVESPEILKNLGNLKYLGKLNYDSVLNFYQKADIGIILFDNVGQYAMANSVKCFEFMAAGMPIVMPNFGEWNEFNKITKCGLNIEVGDYKLAAIKILNLYEDKDLMAEKTKYGRQFVENIGSWQTIEHRLIDLYKSLNI